MKAQDAEIVAGIIISSGLTPTASAVAAKTGSSNAVVAILEVISVRKVTPRQIHRMSRGTGSVARTASRCAISSARPLDENALAITTALMKNSNMLQGISTAVFQSSNRSP